MSKRYYSKENTDSFYFSLQIFTPFWIVSAHIYYMGNLNTLIQNGKGTDLKTKISANCSNVSISPSPLLFLAFNKLSLITSTTCSKPSPSTYQATFTLQLHFINSGNNSLVVILCLLDLDKKL